MGWWLVRSPAVGTGPGAQGVRGPKPVTIKFNIIECFNTAAQSILGLQKVHITIIKVI